MFMTVDKSKILNDLMEYKGIEKKSDFAKFLEISTQNLSVWHKRNTFDEDKLFEKFPEVTKMFILTGEGEMLRSEQKTIEAVPYDQNKHPFVFHVPLVSQYAQAGYLTGYADKEYIEALPTVPFFADHNGKGTYMAFEVRGDSMNDGTSDSILEGDILVCRQINREHWMNKLHIRDWEFVIVHREKGVLVKKIAEHNVEEGVITIHSLNDFYEDIAMLFNVIQKSRKSR